MLGSKDLSQSMAYEISVYSRKFVFVKEVYLALIPFVFGAEVEHIITDIGKYTIGRLRPHFFDVCNPDFTKINCSSGYIVDFVCQGEEENQLREVR